MSPKLTNSELERVIKNVQEAGGRIHKLTEVRVLDEAAKLLFLRTEDIWIRSPGKVRQCFFDKDCYPPGHGSTANHFSVFVDEHGNVVGRTWPKRECDGYRNQVSNESSRTSVNSGGCSAADENNEMAAAHAMPSSVIDGLSGLLDARADPARIAQYLRTLQGDCEIPSNVIANLAAIVSDIHSDTPLQFCAEVSQIENNCCCISVRHPNNFSQGFSLLMQLRGGRWVLLDLKLKSG